MNFNTPNAQDIAAVLQEVERIGFEPCAVLKSNRVGGGILPNGTAVGFRWINGHESWSVWRFAVERGEARLTGLGYDLVSRAEAFARAEGACDHEWSPTTGSVAG